MEDIVRDRTYRFVIAVFGVVFRALGLRLDVRGAENIPATGPAVIACNHVGYLDFTFAGLAATRRDRLVRFMAKSSVFDSPVSGPLVRAMRHIPVVRDAGAGAYRQALRELRAGEVVGMFPESTISRSWQLKAFKDGVAGLAVECGVPIIPVIVWGGHRVLTVDQRFSLRRGKAVTILVGDPQLAAPDAYVGDVRDELHVMMGKMLDEVQQAYPDQPRDSGDRWWLPASLGGTAPSPEEAAILDEEALARGEQRQARRRR